MKIDRQQSLTKLKSQVEPADLEGLTDEQIIAAYQRVHGVPETGEIDSITQRIIDAPRVCGVPDRLAVTADAREAVYRWDHTKWNGREFVGGDDTPCRCTYFVRGQSEALGEGQTRNAIAEAFAPFARVCNVEFVEVLSEPANLVISFVPIDQPGAVLADCQLPAGPDTPKRTLQMRVDSHEQWIISVNPRGGYVDIVRVVRHEGGHFWGVSHIAVGNLMAAMYSENIREFQPGDERELVKRYGPPRAQAPPPTEHPPTQNPIAQLHMQIDDPATGFKWAGTAQAT